MDSLFRTAPISLPFSAKQQIDKICLAFEDAWRAGARPRLEDYLGDAAGPQRSVLLRELLLLELDYRRRDHQQPAFAEYCDRFAQDVALVETVFRCPPAPQAPGLDIEVRYFGDYELLEEIARGGMGVVYKARQISLNRIVALKMILAGQLASQAEVERFHREAEAVAKLQHPHIVAVHEVGVHQQQHYFTMDFVEGKSLAELTRENPLPPQRAAHYVQAIAAAIHYAHGQGILHRDLKPGNVLIDASDQPRITDFGLAKQTKAASDLTTSGQVLGTPSYMPPEQAVGGREPPVPQSDVYALGAILYELVTSRPPFKAESPAETLVQVLQVEPLRPRLFSPKLPRDLETICLKCLEKEPSRRYESAKALADDLCHYLEGRPIRARALGPLPRLWRWCRRRPLVAGLLAALVAALLGGTTASTYFAARATHHAALAEARAQEATDQLWKAYLAQARAARFSGRPGQRLESLQALTAAAAIRPSPELRDEAIACLALADVRRVRQWKMIAPRSALCDPTGERYVMATANAELEVRSMADNRPLVVLRSPGGRLLNYAFSPDGKLLAALYPAGQGQECCVWRLADQKVIWSSPVPATFSRMDFSPDSRAMAVVGIDGKVRVIEIASGKQLRVVECDPTPRILCFSPEGQRIAAFVWQQPVVRVLDLAGGEIMREFSHPGGVHAVSWHPEGNLLAGACADSNIYLWDLETGAQYGVLRGHQAAVMSTGFHARGDLVASRSWDGTTRLWNPFSARELLHLEGGSRSLMLSNDGQRLLLGGYDSVEGWEIVQPVCRTVHEGSRHGERRCWGADFSRDGRWLAAACDDGVRLYEVTSGRQVAYRPMASPASALFHPDGRSLITSDRSAVQQWPLDFDAKSGWPRMGLPQVLSGVCNNATHPTRACLSADGRVLAAMRGGNRVAIHHFDRPSVVTWLEVGSHVCACAISPDGQRVALARAARSGIQVWEVTGGKRSKELPLACQNVQLAFSPDGRWLAANTEQECRCWDVNSWRPTLYVAREGEGKEGPLAFSADSRILAAGLTRYQLQLFDMTTGQRLASFRSRNEAQLAWLCFSPDGSQLAVAGENQPVQLWDLRAIRRQLAVMGLDWDVACQSNGMLSRMLFHRASVVVAGMAQVMPGNWPCLPK